jgi:hypothetical protein
MKKMLRSTWSENLLTDYDNHYQHLKKLQNEGVEHIPSIDVFEGRFGYFPYLLSDPARSAKNTDSFVRRKRK